MGVNVTIETVRLVGARQVFVMQDCSVYVESVETKRTRPHASQAALVG